MLSSCPYSLARVFAVENLEIWVGIQENLTNLVRVYTAGKTKRNMALRPRTHLTNSFISACTYISSGQGFHSRKTQEKYVASKKTFDQLTYMYQHVLAHLRSLFRSSAVYDYKSTKHHFFVI